MYNGIVYTGKTQLGDLILDPNGANYTWVLPPEGTGILVRNTTSSWTQQISIESATLTSINSQFSVSDGSNIVFAVNGQAVSTKSNILDDGQGNVTLTGEVFINGINSVTKFTVQDADSLTVLTAESLNKSVTTFNNILDNGQGNATFTGEVYINGTNAITKFIVQDIDSLTVLTANSIDKSVFTLNNTLDDGQGNMSIYSSMYLSDWLYLSNGHSGGADIFATSNDYNLIQLRITGSLDGATGAWQAVNFMAGAPHPGYSFDSYEGSSKMYFLPGYRGPTPNPSWFTFDLPGTGNVYFWDNVEVEAQLRCNSTSLLKTILPRTDNTFTLGDSFQRWASVWAVNGTIQTSDINDKEEIETLVPDKAVELIRNIRPVKYQWKDTKEKHVGFLAQQIKEALEQCNLPNNGIVYEGEKYCMNYASLIPVIIAALQTLL